MQTKKRPSKLRRAIAKCDIKSQASSFCQKAKSLVKVNSRGKRFFVLPLPTKNQLINFFIAIGAVLTLFFIAYQLYQYYGPHNYQVNSADLLLSPIDASIAKSLNYDEESDSYQFVHGVAASDESASSSSSIIKATIPKNLSKGISVTDPTYELTLQMTPSLPVASPEQQDNRIVYPFRNHNGWIVYTAMGTGIKEDIVLDKSPGDNMTFSYDLSLPDGTEARLEKDGSVGIYGNSLLSNNITTGNDEDAELLQKARENSEKDTLMFNIPRPTVVESGNSTTSVVANFSLDGNQLMVNVKNLANASYPLTIDPSIYIVTAQQFMNGNNETNIDFDVDNKVIKKSATTGARFDSWKPTMNMTTSAWKQGVAAAGGYIYTVGGVHPDSVVTPFTSAGTSSWTVPQDVTSVTIKAWGAGGGGGGGSTNSDGGAGGGGGYVQSTISVTPGETLTVIVGSGGNGGSFSSGGSGNNSGDGGGGGGYTRVNRGSTPLLVAGGGGGGGGGDNSSATPGGQGGGGGGDNGEDGGASSTSYGGGGGTLTSGGSAGTGGSNRGTAGSSFRGGLGADGRSYNSTDGSASNGGTPNGGDGGIGDANSNGFGAGGGGGSGYYGGGGGSGSGSGTAGGGGGGGGSSYSNGTGTTSVNGSGSTPGNNGDADRGSAGNGGAGGTGTGANSTGASGSAGTVFISYTSSTGALKTVQWAKFNTTDGQIESTNPGDGACSGWCTSSLYDLPASRGNFSLVAYNGFLYAIGGESETCTTANGTGDNGICKTVYIAKLGANGEPQLWHPTNSNKSSWTYWYRDTDLSSPRSNIEAVAYNNRLYLMGGTTSSGGTKSVANTTQIADLTPDGRLGSWTNSTTLPYSNYGYTATAYNDRLYIIGGASSIGGSPLTGVYYNKINNDGSLNSWQQTTSLPSGRMSNGGDFSAVWGAYLYVSGGCEATNSNGYCTSIASSTQLASINADGTIDVWNTNGGVSDTRTGHGLLAWRNHIYEVGGCSVQNASDGICGNALSDIQYGKINQDGDASTVADSVDRNTSPCSSATDPKGCDLPGVNYSGNVLSGSAILNGYLYIWGGCDNTSSGCTSVSRSVLYTSIGSDGSLTRPESCGSWSTIDSYCYNTTSLPVANGVGAPGSAVANGYIYSVGGFTSSGMVDRIYYTSPDPTDGSISSWSSADLVGIGAESVSYPYSFTRANPVQASAIPNNLYILGGCTNAAGIGCPASASGYTDSVFKCDLGTTGVPSNCTKSGQLQIGTVPGASSAGLGAMAGTVYANYIYLMGGLTNGLNDLTTTRYAKIDNNNNIVAVSGDGWVESDQLTYYGRRRGSGFGYNGYLYVVGGYDGTGGGGVLADIEFAKINVSDGSIGPWSISKVSIDQRWGLGLAVSNSYAYVIGGCINGSAPTCATNGQTNSIQTFQVYNNDSGAPAEFSTSPQSYNTNPNRLGLSATILNGYIYVAGGCVGTSSCSPTNNVSYAPIDSYGNIGSWSSTSGNLPSGRAWGSLEAAGGTLYYIGGSSDGTDQRNEVYYGTPSAGNVSNWATSSSPLPSARSKFGATSWNDRLYVVGGAGSGGGCTNGVCNTVFVSPLLSSGGNISSSWSTANTSFNVARQGLTAVAYANNLYVLGGDNGAQYFSDTQYAQITAFGASAGLVSGAWNYSTSMPAPISYSDGFAANGYIYMLGGRNALGCSPRTIVAPISANTTIATGNNPTGVGAWYETNQKYSGDRYGNAAVYHQGKSYVLGGATCGSNNDSYTSSGTYTYTVPTGVTSLSVKAWGGGGGGGGGGRDTGSNGGNGGGGGYSTTIIDGLNGGDTLTIKVGGGGGGGDNTIVRSGQGGSGGGSSTIESSSGALYVVAGGGGGGGGGRESGSSSANDAFGGGGNDGGGGTGLDGRGGSQTSGGTAGSGGNNPGSDGSYLSGGSGGDGRSYNSADGTGPDGGFNGGGDGGDDDRNNYYAGGGGGGGGYYGGGGGSGSTYASFGGGGGGGSSYFTGTGNTVAANGSTPGNIADPDVGTAGQGGGGGSRRSQGGNGTDGAVVITPITSSITYSSPAIQQSTLLSQPQVAKYSIMFDTDTDVFPNYWLMNGVDNSIGARWQLNYRSMANQQTTTKCATMSTWGQSTYFGNVTLGTPGAYIVKDGSGNNISCGRFFYYNVTVDSSQAYGYPDDVTRGPTISDLTMQFTADPSKRLMHGRTFTGGLQQPLDTPTYAY